MNSSQRLCFQRSFLLLISFLVDVKHACSLLGKMIKEGDGVDRVTSVALCCIHNAVHHKFPMLRPTVVPALKAAAALLATLS